MASNPVRVPGDVYEQINGAARLLGCSPGDLLGRAWEVYRTSDEFRHDFELAQKAFSVGDLEAVVDRLREHAHKRAATRAAAAGTIE